MKSLYLFFISIIVLTTGALAQTAPGKSIQSFPGWSTTMAFPPDSTVAKVVHQTGIAFEIPGEGYIFTSPIQNRNGTVSASNVKVWIQFTDGTLLEFIPDGIVKAADENSQQNLLDVGMGTPINYGSLLNKSGQPTKVKILQTIEFTHGWQSVPVIKRKVIL